MSETDVQRMSLVGVNPNSRSLKFLNTKNNIATLTLRKQIASFEREKTFSITSLETRRLDTVQFLKQVKALDHEEEDDGKRYLDRESSSVTPPPPPDKPKGQRRRRRKQRLAQTAPANCSLSDDEQQLPRKANGRKDVKSGPETQEEKDHVLKLSRNKSMYLRLAGKGGEFAGHKEEAPRRIGDQKPSSKSLMDVMIGLNAFSYIPSPAPPISSELSESYRGDSRMSIDQDSLFGSHDTIAKRFMLQWKNKVASRKCSIVNRLDGNVPQHYNRCDSLTSVPEAPLASSFNSLKHRRKSKWSTRQVSIKQPQLPSIDDEEERKEQFVAWMNNERQKSKLEKKSVFAGINVNDKQSQRRKSFTCWLQKRQQERKQTDLSDSDDDDSSVIDELSDDDHKSPENICDLMKTILKIKSRFKDPLDARVRKFNNEVDAIKKREEEARNRPLSKSHRRRWKILMQGLDAALAESSDDDDYNNYNNYY